MQFLQSRCAGTRPGLVPPRWRRCRRRDRRSVELTQQSVAPWRRGPCVGFYPPVRVL